MPKPTMGRIVIIVWPDGVESPAIVTRTMADTKHPQIWGAVNSGKRDRWGNTVTPMLASNMHIDVQVQGLIETYPLFNVPFNEDGCAQSWHWPPRVEEDEWHH